MKSGGPWNLRGLRPETRAAAREAARRSGVSVGEWLNNVIQPADEGDESWWSNGDEREAEEHFRRQPGYTEREHYRDASPLWRRRRARYEDDDPPVRRRMRPPREDYPPSGGPYRSAQGRAGEPRREWPRPSDYAPSVTRAEDDRHGSVDHAVAEIEARQRALDSHAAADIQARQAVADIAPSFSEREPQRFPSRPEQSYAASYAEEPPFDLSGLEHQLREITARVAALQSTGDLSTALNEPRSDLAEIGRVLTEALPRRALESLEIEVKALAERIDHTRHSGADTAALAGIERGLAEVREALHRLTPAEGLVTFEEAVNSLSTRLDTIIARDDPATLQQLEAAIGGLRGIVSHVASNDTLTEVAEDVRALSAKIDGLASAAGAPKLTALESRIEMLAGAINASTEAGHAVPRELEKLLSGLIEKLEWVQLTHTDHTALAHLEDRIATLVKRLDASDARLGLLEGVERGLADLLVYIEQLRGGAAAATGVAAAMRPLAANAIEKKVAEIKQTERRTQDSLENMQGTVEHVVDRLARIESNTRGDKMALLPAEPAEPSPVTLKPPDETAAMIADAEADAAAQPQEQQKPQGPDGTPPPAPLLRPAAARIPIDPSLPPNHPLEPGSAAGRRREPSAAQRIAASEAAIGAKRPVIPDPDGGKSDFIAAARRAAKAAALTAPPDRAARKPLAGNGASGKKLSERIRTLAVAAAVVVIIVGGFHIVSRLFEDGGSNPAPQAHTEPPRVLSEPLQLQAEPKPLPEQPHVQAEAPPPAAAPEATPAPGPAVIQVRPAGGDSTPSPGAASPNAAMPGEHQSSVNPAADEPQVGTAIADAAVAAPVDITGSLPKTAAPRGTAIVPAPMDGDKLPVAIGSPTLRNAAVAGDPYAAYEVAIRFAEGRVVSTNNEEAARWFEIAAKKGLAPAEFRLGALYEKGLGVKENLVMARDLYRAAADKGHGKAMHNLAVLYAEGVDGKADYRTAVQWFRKAADRGVADSQFNLAVLYARGVGVEQNFAESYKWFFLAAKDGDADAAKKRDEVAAHLDEAAREKARHTAEQWKPLAPPADAVTVRGAWDARSKAAPAKTKGRASAKAPASDSAKVN
jgi:localization factor PodJL